MENYNHYDQFQKTLLPLTTSRYVADRGGSPCWVCPKVEFGVTLESFKSSSDIAFDVYITYYDDQSGYIRICYDVSGTLTYATVIAYTETHTWKSVRIPLVGSLNSIFEEDGDFQLYASTTEDTLSDISLTIRNVSVYRIDLGQLSTWNVIGTQSMQIEDLSSGSASGSSRGGIIPVSDTTILSRQHGHMCLNQEDSDTTPIIISAGSHNSEYWRNTVDGYMFDMSLRYYDNGTNNIHVTYNTDVEELTKKLCTKTNTEKWIEASSVLQGIVGTTDGDFALYSDATSTSDSIIEEHDIPLTITTDVYHDISTPLFGSSSLKFDGDDQIIIEAGDDDMFNFDTNPFTVMYWFSSIGSYHQNMITNNDDGAYTGFLTHLYYSDFYVYGKNGNSRFEVSSGTHGIDFIDGNWHHIALSGDGSNLHLWLDGTQYYTTPYTYMAFDSENGVYIGRRYWNFTGYMQDIYVNNGVCKFTDSFTLPTTLLRDDPNYNISGSSQVLLDGDYANNGDIKIQSKSVESVNATLYIVSDTSTPSDPIVDYTNTFTIQETSDVTHNTSIKKYGQSSLYFNGSSYLTIADVDTVFNIGMQPFTIMWWGNHTISGYGQFLATSQGLGNNGWEISFAPGGELTVGMIDNGYIGVSGVSLNDGNWHHHCITGDASYVRVYLDGVLQVTETYSYVGYTTTTNNFYIGNNPENGNDYYVGYIDDLYMYIGEALYTGALMTPPTDLVRDTLYTVTPSFIDPLYISNITLTDYNTQSHLKWNA